MAQWAVQTCLLLWISASLGTRWGIYSLKCHVITHMFRIIKLNKFSQECDCIYQYTILMNCVNYKGWKVDLFWESRAQKIMGRPRRTIQFDRKNWAGKTWRILNVTNNWPAWKKARIPKESTQSHVSSRQCYITYGKTGTDSRHVGSTQLRSSTSYGLLTRLGSFRLPLVCIDGKRTCWWAALLFVRRCEKMVQWMVRNKRENFYWRDIHKLQERWENV